MSASDLAGSLTTSSPSFPSCTSSLKAAEDNGHVLRLPCSQCGQAVTQFLSQEWKHLDVWESSCLSDQKSDLYGLHSVGDFLPALNVDMKSELSVFVC